MLIYQGSFLPASHLQSSVSKLSKTCFTMGGNCPDMGFFNLSRGQFTTAIDLPLVSRSLALLSVATLYQHVIFPVSRPVLSSYSCYLSPSICLSVSLCLSHPGSLCVSVSISTVLSLWAHFSRQYLAGALSERTVPQS